MTKDIERASELLSWSLTYQVADRDRDELVSTLKRILEDYERRLAALEAK